MQTRTANHPSYRTETLALLEEIGKPAGPLPYKTLVASRERRPEPRVRAVRGPMAAPADLILPLPDADVRVRIYRAEPARPRPLLLWLHGGGFIGGSLDDVEDTCLLLARQAGVTVVSLDYRLAPEHPYPAALTDTRDTLRWLRTHGDLLGGDGRLVAGGQSAGATLVAAACLQARDEGDRGADRQVLCYPWLDPSEAAESRRLFDGLLFTAESLRWHHELYLQGEALTPYVTPWLAESLAGLPPALVLGAGMDPLRDDAWAYAVRLGLDGVDTSYVEYAHTMHAFLNFPGVLSAAGHAIADIAAYLRGGATAGTEAPDIPFRASTSGSPPA